MAKVKINDKYSVEVEEKCLSLQTFMGHYTHKDTGKQYETWTNLGHFSSWENVLSRLHRLFTIEKMEKKDFVTLEELKKITQEVTKEIKNLTKGLI